MKKIFIFTFLAILSITMAYAEDGHGGGWGGDGGERGGGLGRDGGGERGGNWGREGGGGWGRGGGYGWQGGGYGWVAPLVIGGVIGYGLASPDSNNAQPVPVYAQPAPVSGGAVPPGQFYYFCPAANAYYPNVPSCPNGWQLVPATPPQ